MNTIDNFSFQVCFIDSAFCFVQICFWLIENGFRVLIAACDTFRAGAVEQLRTHVARLNTLHPPENGIPNVFLYEKGYGKDAAGIAMQAVNAGICSISTVNELRNETK